MGMSYRDFWYGRADMVCGYSKAYRMGLEQNNHDMHLQGAYFHNALISALSGMGKKPINYVEKPFDVLPKTKADIKQEREEDEKRVDRFFGFLERFKVEE